MIKCIKVIFEGIYQDESRLTTNAKYGIMDELQEYYSVKEFAVLIRVHYNTVIRSIKAGKLIALRIGYGKKATYRIPHSEINRIAFLNLEELVNEIIERKK
jgi:excisionase family DNA binding protein